MAHTTSKKLPTPTVPRVSPKAEADAQTAASIMRALDAHARQIVLRWLRVCLENRERQPIAAPAEIPGLLSAEAVALLAALPPECLGLVLTCAGRLSKPAIDDIRPYLLPHQVRANSRRERACDHIVRQTARRIAKGGR